MLKIKKNTKEAVELTAPPSKAHTLRAFFLAGLSNDKCLINNPLMGEDQQIALDSLKVIGVTIEKKGESIEINGINGKPKLKESLINCGNSGVSLRFITSIIALSEIGSCVIDGDENMRKRPIKDLVDALKLLGIKIDYLEKEGFPPIKVHGGSFQGGKTKIDGSKSSQFLSSLLIAGACSKKGLEIEVMGELVSKPYIDITIDLMKKFGVIVENNDYKSIIVKGNQVYSCKELKIEGDYSNSSYFFMAAAICKIKVSVSNLNPNSTQGDKKILEILEQMGCKVTQYSDMYMVIGQDLQGITINMVNFPDLVPTVAVTAAFAKGKTHITNVGHLKHKESDRFKSIINELKKMNIEAKQTGEDLIVIGGDPKGAIIETYDDHRIAMSFGVTGLVVDDVQIKNPVTVAKSFPNFFTELSKFSE